MPELFQWNIVRAVNQDGGGILPPIREGILSLSALGEKCLQRDPATRPTFTSVAAELNAIALVAYAAINMPQGEILS